MVNNLPANAGEARDSGSIPGLGRSPVVCWLLLTGSSTQAFHLVQEAPSKDSCDNPKVLFSQPPTSGPKVKSVDFFFLNNPLMQMRQLMLRKENVLPEVTQ